ncbi:MAG: hypothetical protein A2X56_14025 [Nitrospirae bacterium GWC2_57_13]|jgi:hypothetical protein|nr:MAG: hypothetical protein A2072_01935 [Nitrospirae bacterium GWC1_57_7]OGW28550.1 MAG: hypothetical protein A2X56_14025 [Nitrospirae bacterium GWC2_57_13]HAS55616.1 hypothetical protein [Nitrospiraceae bacterium]
MLIALRQRERGQIDFGLLYGGIVLLGLLAVRFLPVARFLPSCYFRSFLGIPCPSCGTTRSIVSLVRGDVLGSLVMNPLAAVVIHIALLWFGYSVLAALFVLPRPSLLLTEKEKNAVRLGAVMLALANWAYLVIAL